MATVNSVLGPCEPKDLGFTLIHEHLTAGFPGFEFDNAGFNRKEEVAKAVEKLKELKGLGVSTFVDPCPMELGRDVEFAAEASEKSGLRVIMATGLYNEALGIPPHFRSLPADDIAEVYVRELTDGIGKTGIKAGIIKTATGGIPGMTETAKTISKQEEKCLRAAARAHKATGAPILCHNDELGPFGRETLDIFADEGVNFNRVLIGHACGVGDMRYYFDILDRGAWIGFDRFGIETIASDKMRLASLIGLLAVGYDRIMLSQDHVGCWLGRVSKDWQAFMEKCPNWSYSHVCRTIIPTLNKAGVSEGTIRTMMVDNPRSYFGG
ncbi:MAG TPA: phosphotriesterase-related protein [Methylomirabilota bacterium]|jgi:phosphotriesterase-related protein|nr:phosphotriesterase-related protein [Methylomirabilota bacterium]